MKDYRNGIEQNLAPIALEFFATFSRFEFALKRGNYAAGDEGKKASPDWIGFASDLGDDFFKQMEAADPARIFFEAPPKRLTIKVGGGVEFTDQDKLTNTQMLLAAVGLVRNNLFHGEKIWMGERDEALIRASLFVLDSAHAAANTREDMRQVCAAFRYAEINPH
jgi:hypothetical protein